MVKLLNQEIVAEFETLLSEPKLRKVGEGLDTNFIKKVELCHQVIRKARPFEGEMLKQVRDFFRISTTWSSNALEGNTLTISETKVLLEDGITVGGKSLREALEAYGHSHAYDYMFSLIDKKTIRESDIKELHRLFYSGISESKAGVYRTVRVVITGSSYPVCAPDKIGQEIKYLCDWIEKERSSYDPVTFAAELHRRFIFIHPFEDGNGRTARLLMNTALIQKGYLPCVISPYLRNDYIQALEGAHAEPEKFIRFIAEAELETEKDFIRALGLEMPDMKRI